jgi:hypothetical protein
MCQESISAQRPRLSNGRWFTGEREDKKREDRLLFRAIDLPDRLIFLVNSPRSRIATRRAPVSAPGASEVHRSTVPTIGFGRRTSRSRIRRPVQPISRRSDQQLLRYLLRIASRGCSSDAEPVRDLADLRAWVEPDDAEDARRVSHVERGRVGARRRSVWRSSRTEAFVRKIVDLVKGPARSKRADPNTDEAQPTLWADGLRRPPAMSLVPPLASIDGPACAD